MREKIMGSIGWSEIIVILLVVLLLFGSKRIPELARALGKASHEFKRAKESILREGEELIDEAERTAAVEEKASPAADENKRS
jgi:sec-independent protein translocase protein TatA